MSGSKGGTSKIVSSYIANSLHADKAFRIDDLIRYRPEEGWLVLKALVDRASSEEEIDKLAGFGGPLESLIFLHSDAMIERIEAEAAANEALCDVLGHVKPSFDRISPPMWERIQKAARLTPEPYPVDRMQELEEFAPGVEQIATADFFPPGVHRPAIVALADEEIAFLVDGWYRYHETFWAFNEVSDVIRSGETDAAWKLVLDLVTAAPDDEVLYSIAAGPVEDFLSGRGEEVIERVEARAREDERFRECLGGVWKSGMSDEIWERVEKAAEG